MNKTLIIALLISTLTIHAISLNDLTKSCEKKSARACHDLGYIYDKQGKVKDAANLYRRACDLKDAVGCFKLAELYLVGSGVPQSDQNFVAFMRRSCRLGYQKSCAFIQEAKAIPKKPTSQKAIIKQPIKRKPFKPKVVKVKKIIPKYMRARHKSTAPTTISQKHIGEITVSAKIIDASKRIVQIDASMQNLFREATGWLSFSFPDIKNDRTSAIRSEGFDHIKAYPHSYSIYHTKRKKAIPSIYLLVEGEAKKWKKNQQKKAHFQITVPANIQTLTLYVRGTFKHKDQLRSLPIKGTIGQQGFYNRVITLPIGKSTQAPQTKSTGMTIDLGHLSASTSRSTTPSVGYRQNNTVTLSRQDKLLLLDKLMALTYYHRERKAFEKQLQETLFGGATYLTYIKSYRCTPRGNTNRNRCVLKLHGQVNRDNRMIHWEFHAAFTATKDEDGLRITEMHSLDLFE